MKLYREEKYSKIDEMEASKELNDEKRPPKYYVVSEVTGNEICITHLVDITRVRRSSRVHIYEAKGVPVFNSDKYKTKVYYWKNKMRTHVYEKES